MGLIRPAGCGSGCNADKYSINMVRGDSVARGLTVQLNGAPLILSENAVVRLAIRSGDSVVVLKTYTSDAQNSDGKIDISLFPSDTENLAAGEYDYEIEIEDEGTIITPIQSTLTLREDIITPEVRGNA